MFYHVKFRRPSDGLHAKFEPFLAPLVRAASDFSNCPKHIRKIQDLISIWEEERYFTGGTIPALRAAVEQEPSPSDSGENGSEQSRRAAAAAKAAKEQPFIMPAMHGDPTTPWYDLPAGNWLTALEPNSTRPMNPSMIRPLQLASGPADKNLVEAVKKLLVDVDKIYTRDVSHMDDASLDVDQMGEPVELDEITGEIIGGETYYGWSRAFCHKMKSRRRKRNDPRADNDRHRGRSSESDRSISRSRSPDRSRSSSRAAMKRRRISTSPDGRSRKRSRSRSRSQHRGSSRGRSWSSSRSRSRSRPPGQKDTKRRRSISPRYSPPPAMPAHQNGNGRGYHPFNQPQMPPAPFGLNQFPPVPPMGAMPPMPPHPSLVGYQSPPVPPPPPPNYQGQWPPPPPPPPPSMGSAPPGFFPAPTHSSPPLIGGWGQQPPPQTQPQNQYQNQYGGRGNNSFQRGGRGGYGRRGW